MVMNGTIRYGMAWYGNGNGTGNSNGTVRYGNVCYGNGYVMVIVWYGMVMA